MPNDAIKGRGAVSAPEGRFAVTKVERDDGARRPDERPGTVLAAMNVRRIISSNSSPDVPFDRSINPYQGCEHGCIYCYARPSHSYLDLSPGLDFETRIFYKAGAAERLIEEWSKPGYECQPIALGANTDPYQPAEKKLGITRRLLETFLEYRHPVTIITKGGLMCRDLDLLAALAAQRLVSVAISVPTADPALKRILEPRVPDAAVRFRLMAELAAAGVPVGLLLAPVIPAVNDGEIETILEQAAKAGAKRASWILLRLPHEVKALFGEWLETHMPERAAHVMSLIRQMSGGRDYDSRFGRRQRGRGPYAQLIGDRFRQCCRRLGLNADGETARLDCSRFRSPGDRQLGLAFD